MADIAMVFHWGPAEMEFMPLEELADWRERARKRHDPQPAGTPPKPSRRKR